MLLCRYYVCSNDLSVAVAAACVCHTIIDVLFESILLWLVKKTEATDQLFSCLRTRPRSYKTLISLSLSMRESRLPQRCGYCRSEDQKIDVLFVSNILFWKEGKTKLTMVSDDEKSKVHFVSCRTRVNRNSHWSRYHMQTRTTFSYQRAVEVLDKGEREQVVIRSWALKWYLLWCLPNKHPCDNIPDGIHLFRW